MVSTIGKGPALIGRVAGSYTGRARIMDSRTPINFDGGAWRRENEETMKAIITIDKKDALLAGVDNQGDYEIDFSPTDLTPEQRVELSLSSLDNKGVWRACVMYYTLSSYGVVVPDIVALRSILDQRIAIRAKRAADDAAKAARQLSDDTKRLIVWAALPPDRHIWETYKGHEITWPINPCKVPALAKIYPEVREVIEDAKSLIFWWEAELNLRGAREMREKREAEARAAIESEAKASRREAQLAAWVAEQGTDNQRARAAEGLLPDDEVIDDIRSAMFLPLAGLKRYTKIKRTDFCECEEAHQTPDTDFTVEDADSVSNTEYERICQIRDLMPGARGTLRRHTGCCSICKNEMSRGGIMVRLTIGELSLSREYADE